MKLTKAILQYASNDSTNEDQTIYELLDTTKTEMVRTFERAEWDTLSKLDQRKLFSKTVIHVRGAAPFKVLPDVSSLDSLDGLSAAIDLDKALFCQGELYRTIPQSSHT